jgi:hypothetical protein
MVDVDRRRAARVGHRSALHMLVGLLLSGPATVVAVSLRFPQPVAWQGASAAPLFPGSGRARRIRCLAVGNGLLGGLAGLAACVLWNVLFLALVVEHVLQMRAIARR